MYANYGSYRPRHDPIQTYLMLGAYGQGPTWTYFDFYKVAELIVTGQIRRATAKTHEDGRLGQVQLLPDEWQLMARDGNKDGRVDIWSNQADIFASIGPIEWEAGTPMVVEVRRPRLDPSNPAEARMLRGIESGSVGVHMFPRPGGGRWPAESRGWGGRYVQPFGPSGPAYILTRNFTPVNYRNPSKPRYWDESEDPGFGLAVALLADAIAGRPGPSVPFHQGQNTRH
jgi:membrane-bound lytic murein transglycosylase B